MRKEKEDSLREKIGMILNRAGGLEREDRNQIFQRHGWRGMARDQDLTNY